MQRTITDRAAVSLLALTMLATTSVCSGKTVGIWKDRKSGYGDGMLTTLKEAGWQTVILQGKDLTDGSKLADLDVVFLPGGHNIYAFPGFEGSRNLIKFVADGKGILAGAFRSGYARTSNRPLFPQVGAAYNKANSVFVRGVGDSELAKAIDKPFCPGGWDHVAIKVGPLGTVFAVSDVNPVGVYAEIYGGRYVAFGGYIGCEARTEPMQGTARRVLLAMLDWLAAAPELSDAEKAKTHAQAELDLLRRERLLDWTLNERGPDRGPGILPAVRNRLAVPLQSRQYTLDYMAQYLSRRKLRKCKSEAMALSKAAERLDKNLEREIAEFEKKTKRMGLKELLPEDKTVTLEMIEAVQGRTEEEKKGIIGLVKRAHPGAASKRVAMYLHEGSIGERLMPKTELGKLVGRA